MKFKMIFKAWWFWTGLVVIIVGGGFYFHSINNKKGPEYITEIVKKGSLAQTVDSTGTLESTEKVNLNFETTGIIESVFADVGESVKVGTLLATLKNDELAANLARARYVLDSAEATLNQREAGSTSEAVAVAEAGVGVAQAGLAAQQTVLKNVQTEAMQTQKLAASSVSEAEVALKKAQDALQNILATDAEASSQVRQNYVTTLQSSMTAVRTGLSAADSVLGIDNTLANDSFQNMLSNLDAQALVSATASYNVATQERDLAEPPTFALTSSSTMEEITPVISLVQTALDETADTLLYTRQVLDATSLTSATFTQADLAALKTSIDTARQSIQTAQNLLVTKRQLDASTTVQNKTNEDNGQHAVTSAQQALQTAQVSADSKNASASAAVQSAETAIKVSEADLARAQATLAQTSATPRSVDLAPLEADVQRAQADVNAAQARYENAFLRSPIEGTITAFDIKPGQLTLASVPAVTIQATQEQFHITTNIPESDIAKISLNDTADVTMDAFGSDVHFSGHIGKIDPAEKRIEGVVYYEVTVYLDPTQVMGIKPGLSADITILTEQKDHVLSVSQRAVLQKEGKKYVRVLRGETIEEKSVTVGLRGDDGRVEIVDGISEGDQIVIGTKGASN